MISGLIFDLLVDVSLIIFKHLCILYILNIHIATGRTMHGTLLYRKA